MLGPSEYRDIVSGRRHGLAPAILRSVLRVMEVPYTMAVVRRNRRYDAHRMAIHRADVPVISVGNLTLGGTGKTPVVKWIVRWLSERGIRPAIVSRGYGAAAGKQNDEFLELQQALPRIPHRQNPDRFSAATQAIRDDDAQAIVVDDGFQHRRLARDLDIVLLDALEPFGYDHVFPRGTLREPATGLARADIVCLSRADVISQDDRERVRQRVLQLAPMATWCELRHAPSHLINTSAHSLPLERLRGLDVAAFCGVGNPSGFRHTLADTKCNVVAWRTFPDHHRYSSADTASLDAFVRRSRAAMAVCTHKDLVKLSECELGGVPLWAVAIEMQFLAGQQEFESRLNAAVSSVNGRS